MSRVFGSRQSRWTLAILAVIGLFVLVTTLGSTPARSGARLRLEDLLHESSELGARQEVLRRDAFELSDQVCRRLDEGRRAALRADMPARTPEARCLEPPGRDARSEVVLVWLARQGAQLEDPVVSADAAVRPRVLGAHSEGRTDE